jgi:hypothetical protein
MGVPFVRIWTADEAAQTLELRGFSDDQLAVGYPTKKMRFGERGVGWVAVHRRTLHRALGYSPNQWHCRCQVRGPGLDVCQLPVLVVDDNAVNRRILHDMLAHWQMRPTAVEGGEAALAALARANDYGYALPMLSSTDVSRDAARCRELGIPIYLTKPIIQSDLTLPQKRCDCLGYAAGAATGSVPQGPS